MNQKTRRRWYHPLQRQTVIGLGIALGIFGFIATAIAISAIPMLNAARRDRAALDLKTFEAAMRLCYRKHGRIPEMSGGFKVLVDAGCLDGVPRDPYDNDYVYRLEDGASVILSYGGDGEPGGTGIDADISRKLQPLP
jgi:general secretion pathway protein G